jgi:hypothetical protein
MCTWWRKVLSLFVVMGILYVRLVIMACLWKLEATRHLPLEDPTRIILPCNLSQVCLLLFTIAKQRILKPSSEVQVFEAMVQSLLLCELFDDLDHILQSLVESLSCLSTIEGK